ncbi:MAG: pyridoxamine 5'-phosphate oxidase family protein [Acidimicrobiia bacterium]|nr:pyridoxamine 5'-phosphate oxidase family protein [Acidimicrobiia bacterium]
MRTIDTRTGLERIPRDECVELLAAQEVGRLVVVEGDRALVFPVNYAMDGDAVVFHTADGIKLASARHHRVTFEVDETDRESRSGWSVVVQGVAQEITNFDASDVVERLGELRVNPWAPGDKRHVVRIVPLQITGRRVRSAA